MKQVAWRALSAAEKTRLLSRPSAMPADLSLVAQIVDDVQRRGDAAVREYTERFDRCFLQDFAIAPGSVEKASDALSVELRDAVAAAAGNIRRFHARQRPRDVQQETAPGVFCSLEWRPIESVGLYIPGGSAPLFSTVLMLGIPAQLAGCQRIVLCTPPSASGAVRSEILYAAHLAGIHEIHRIGGIQAIAALGLGTESVPRVNKIFGPGNRYVAAAKAFLAQMHGVGIDLVAGPSELLIVADQAAQPDAVAADLLTQAEHGPDSRVVLVALPGFPLHEFERSLSRQLRSLPRETIAQEALENSCAILAEELDDALEISNAFAPEHLMLCIQNADAVRKQVRNAGSVFIGNNTSVVFGDYASGTNHTLPTGGTARHSGGITLASFLKPVYFQQVAESALGSLSRIAETLAVAEGLGAHAAAARLRRRSQPAPPPGRIKPALRSFAPYSSARSEARRGEIFLDANELSWGSGVTCDGVSLNRYPDPNQLELRKEIGRYAGLDASRIFASSGSDEAIDLLIQLFCEPEQDSIAVLHPTYGVYSVAAQLHRVPVQLVDLDERFDIDSSATRAAISDHTRMIFCCSPNNPTGNRLTPQRIVELCRFFDGIVVVDEAYVEFASDSMVQSLLDFPQAVVLRTFSKAWGLAGIRLGYCIAAPEIVNGLLQIKAPYNISGLTSAFALRALKNPGFLRDSVSAVIRERERMREKLNALGSAIKIFPSEANFLLVQFENAPAVYEHLQSRGIIVRRRSEQRIRDCLRVTIGTSGENDLLLKTIGEIA